VFAVYQGVDVFHWITPLLIGVYIGILIGPGLRVWAASKDWERQARGDITPPESWSHNEVIQNESRIPDLDWFDDPLSDRP
jgi:hypothetical protein